MFTYVTRASELYVVGDASKHAGGGLLAPFGVWWRIDWPRAVVERFEVMERKEKGSEETVNINHLELAVAVLGLGVLKEVPAVQGVCLVGKAVSVLSDNYNTVYWMKKAAARDPRAHALMRLHGVEEMLGRYTTKIDHVAGKKNVHPDKISRLPSVEIAPYMSGVACPLTCAPTLWTQVGVPSLLWKRVIDILCSSTPISA
jgi:hypothetical protein